MKVLSTDGLTELIQLIKSSFISNTETEQTMEIDTAVVNEVTLVTVATTGDYDDLTNKPDLTAYALDANVVHLAGAETITGTKTFSSAAYGTASDAVNSILTTVNKNKSGNGYFKLGNGLIIQWGSASVSSHIANVNLPTAFTSTNYQISALRVASSSTTNESNPFYTRSKTTTTFQLYNPGNNATSVSWIAVGY